MSAVEYSSFDIKKEGIRPLMLHFCPLLNKKTCNLHKQACFSVLLSVHPETGNDDLNNQHTRSKSKQFKGQSEVVQKNNQTWNSIN